MKAKKSQYLNTVDKQFYVMAMKPQACTTSQCRACKFFSTALAINQDTNQDDLAICSIE